MHVATEVRPFVDAATDAFDVEWWQLIPATHVPFDELYLTQDTACLACLLDRCEHRLRSRDAVAHVVVIGGRHYVVDGHHRLVRRYLSGARSAYVRVFEP